MGFGMMPKLGQKFVQMNRLLSRLDVNAQRLGSMQSNVNAQRLESLLPNVNAQRLESLLPNVNAQGRRYYSTEASKETSKNDQDYSQNGQKTGSNGSGSGSNGSGSGPNGSGSGPNGSGSGSNGSGSGPNGSGSGPNAGFGQKFKRFAKLGVDLVGWSTVLDQLSNAANNLHSMYTRADDSKKARIFNILDQEKERIVNTAGLTPEDQQKNSEKVVNARTKIDNSGYIYKRKVLNNYEKNQGLLPLTYTILETDPYLKNVRNGLKNLNFRGDLGQFNEEQYGYPNINNPYLKNVRKGLKNLNFRGDLEQFNEEQYGYPT